MAQAVSSQHAGRSARREFGRFLYFASDAWRRRAWFESGNRRRLCSSILLASRCRPIVVPRRDARGWRHRVSGNQAVGPGIQQCRAELLRFVRVSTGWRNANISRVVARNIARNAIPIQVLKTPVRPGRTNNRIVTDKRRQPGRDVEDQFRKSDTLNSFAEW